MGSFVIIVQPIFAVIERSNWYKSISGAKKDEISNKEGK
jgi:hypothetical protein